MTLTTDKINDIKETLSQSDGNIKLKAIELEINLLERAISLLEKIESNTRK